MNLDFQINNFDELRDEIFSLFPELSNIDNCISSDHPKLQEFNEIE